MIDEQDRTLVNIPAGTNTELEGILCTPKYAKGIVLFVHGSGSSRHSPRNQYVTQPLHNANIATLLFDLLTPEEEKKDVQTKRLRFDIKLLSKRLIAATNWIEQNPQLKTLNLGYYGASTGATAALVAAAKYPNNVKAIVSRGGRPDLAGSAILSHVKAPTLFIVGRNDVGVLEVNRKAFKQLHRVEKNEKKIVIIDGATHLFEEPGKIEQVAKFATEWFERNLIHPTAE